MGGLGNQLFQYALGFCLKHEGIAVKMDEITAQSFEHKRKVQLQEMGVSYDAATTREIEEYLDDSRNIFKRIKAIIELIEGYVVYGELTASRLLDIKERKLSWNDARKYIKNFSYPCRSNEKIVWYTGKQLQDVYLY